MYQSSTSLEPALPPRSYWHPDDWAAERAKIFEPAWHLVATRSDLREHGQFASLTHLGVPLLVRNFDGELVAFRNVCAHRHALLTTKARGKSETLRCPFHGWEYGADGRTRKLPGATNFPKFDHARYCLDRFPVECCGDLVFVRMTPVGESLREFLGHRFELFESWFTPPEYEQTMRLRMDYEVNWKIPIDVSLESYHIPYVHEATFSVDPGEALSSHEFFDRGSSFDTTFLAPRWIDRRLRDVEKLVFRILGSELNPGYQHHHVYPNLLFSHTDSLTIVQAVHPAGATSSYSLVWQYGRFGQKRSLFPRTVAQVWGRIIAQVSKQILAEDVAILPLVQEGVRHTPRTGLLGRCEERIYAYQAYVRDQLAKGGVATSSGSAQTGCSSRNGMQDLAGHACPAAAVDEVPDGQRDVATDPNQSSTGLESPLTPESTNQP